MLEKLDKVMISLSKLTHYKELANDQVQLMKNDTIPLYQSYLDYLNFALEVEQ